MGRAKTDNGDRIAEAYRNGTGVSELARMHGITRNSVYDILHARNVTLKPCTANGRKTRGETVEYKGKRYTWRDKNGFWRCTSMSDRHNLAWRIYEEHTGEKVRKGMEVYFRDGDRYNFAPENLVCTTKSERMKERLKDPDFRAYVHAVGAYARLAKAVADEIDPSRKAAFANRMWASRRAAGTDKSMAKAWETRRAKYGPSGFRDLEATRKAFSEAHKGKPRKRS